MAPRKLRRAERERNLTERQREISAADVEPDEVLTAFELTFMHLCFVRMRTSLGRWIALEARIDTVLTLHGERAVSDPAEAIRIDRPERAAPRWRPSSVPSFR